MYRTYPEAIENPTAREIFTNSVSMGEAIAERGERFINELKRKVRIGSGNNNSRLSHSLDSQLNFNNFECIQMYAQEQLERAYLRIHYAHESVF